MSAMSASSGLMPLSLISEHKAAQGGPPPVQQLAFEKHSLVQAPKPTPNGMEPSPPLVPVLPPSQPEPQPSLPCGGVSESIGEECSGGAVPDVEPSPPVAPAVAAEPPAAEPAPEPPSLPPPAQEPPAICPAVLEAPPPAEPLPELPLPAQEKPAADIAQPPAEPAAPTPQEQPLPEATPQTEPQENGQEPNPEPMELPVVQSKPEQPAPAQFTPAPAQSISALPATSSTGRAKRTKASSSNTEKKSAPAVSTPSPEAENGDDKRAKRKRLPTQVYQSPIPEENLIAKISKIDKTPAPDDKLIVFYRNEFLAVRNAEGSFYVCQAMQNVYKSSAKIRIRWLSQVQNTDHYSPDFYDTTEFDCILTNLNLERIEKNKYRLPDIESQRTQSILKRAIDVENGVAPAEDTTVTEEHPDGLDLSLYRNEDQLKKRKRGNKNKGNKRVKKTLIEKKGSRVIPKRNKAPEVKKPAVVLSQTKRVVGRIVKDKPVVQRIVAAKKMGKRKAGKSSPPAVSSISSSSSKASPTPVAPANKEAPKKKEQPPRSVPQKRKSTEPPAAPVPEKKQKTGASSKTRSGVAGGPSEPQEQPPTRARRSTTRTK